MKELLAGEDEDMLLLRFMKLVAWSYLKELSTSLSSSMLYRFIMSLVVDLGIGIVGGVVLFEGVKLRPLKKEETNKFEAFNDIRYNF